MSDKHKCSFPDGISVRPDGVNELDLCPYHLKEIHRNVTVEVLQCPICGHIEVNWIRQDDTEDEIVEPIEERN